MTTEHKPQISPREMRCEPGEGVHTFERHEGACDCGRRSWPNTTSTFVIPDGELWRVSPLPTTVPAGWSV